jgi:hypothetical protein
MGGHKTRRRLVFRRGKIRETGCLRAMALSMNEQGKGASPRAAASAGLTGVFLLRGVGAILKDSRMS